jgi:hypothetical protein
MSTSSDQVFAQRGLLVGSRWRGSGRRRAGRRCRPGRRSAAGCTGPTARANRSAARARRRPLACSRWARLQRRGCTARQVPPRGVRSCSPACIRAPRRRPGCAPSQQPPLGKRHHLALAHHQVVEHAHVDQRQCALQRLGEVSSARDGSARPDGWLCARITAPALSARARLHDLARVDAGLRQRCRGTSPPARSAGAGSRNSTANTSCVQPAERSARSP